MRISGDGHALRVARVTGPTHDVLRLTAERHLDRTMSPLVVVDQPPALLPEADLSAAVMQGCDDAGGLDDLDLCISSTLYVGSDTPSVLTDRRLARALVEHERAEVLAKKGGEAGERAGPPRLRVNHRRLA